MSRAASCPRIRVGVVGCGKIASHHLRGIASSGAAAVVVLVDPNPVRRAAVHQEAIELLAVDPNCPISEYAQLADVPEHAVDVTLLCVPHDLHEELGTQALARGACIIEKPLATTAEGCSRIEQAAKRQGSVLFVAENSAFWPEVTKARALIQSGSIGDLVSIHSHYYESLVDCPFGGSEDDPFDLGWRKSLKRSGGGVCMDGGLHWLRPLRMLAGPISAVVGSAARPFESIEGESLMHALLRFENPSISATFRATFLSHSRLGSADPWFRMIGTKGELVIDAAFKGGMTLHTDSHPEGMRIAVEPAGFLGSFEVQWKDIVSCLRNGKESELSPVSEAVTDVAVVEALYRSILTREWQTVGHVSQVGEIPTEQIEFLENAHGLQAVARGGRGECELRWHFTGVRQLLIDKLGIRDPALLAAALFHSVYGTEGFQGVVLDLGRRGEVQCTIGMHAELLSYLNCVMDRGSFYNCVKLYREGSEQLTLKSRPELEATQHHLTRMQFKDLMIVHFATWAQQVAAYSFWNYRRSSYAAIAAALGGIFAEVYADTIAEQPEDALNQMPEVAGSSVDPA